MNRRSFLSSVLLLCILLFGAASARATTIIVEGGINTFSGVVFGNVAPSYLWVNQGVTLCQPSACPSSAGLQICPDLAFGGCSAFSGMATNVDLDTNPFSSLGTRVIFGTEGATPYNELTFRPSGSFDGEPEEEFRLGTLTFANGLWTGDADFGFSIKARVLSVDHVFTGFLHMDLTPNTGTAAANADYIVLRTAAGTPVLHPLTLKPLGSVRAYEGSSVTVTLWGSLGSLDPTRFSDPTEGGFIDASITDDLANPVPEAGTLGLLSLGIGALAIIRKRRQ